jgi:hypothetical protein
VFTCLKAAILLVFGCLRVGVLLVAGLGVGLLVGPALLSVASGLVTAHAAPSGPAAGWAVGPAAGMTAGATAGSGSCCATRLGAQVSGVLLPDGSTARSQDLERLRQWLSPAGFAALRGADEQLQQALTGR